MGKKNFFFSVVLIIAMMFTAGSAMAGENLLRIREDNGEETSHDLAIKARIEMLKKKEPSKDWREAFKKAKKTLGEGKRFSPADK